MLAWSNLRVQQNSSQGEVMTEQERQLATKATTQLRLGNGLFMNDREFKAWFCKENGLTEPRLTQLVKDLLDGK